MSVTRFATLSSHEVPTASAPSEAVVKPGPFQDEFGDFSLDLWKEPLDGRDALAVAQDRAIAAALRMQIEQDCGMRSLDGLPDSMVLRLFRS